VESPLSFRLGGLPEGVSQHRLELTPEQLDLTSAECGFSTAASVALEIIRQGEQLQVRGTASIGVDLACVRCLKETAARVTAEFSVVARPRPAREADEGEAPDGMLLYDGESLELTTEVRDALLLEVPAAPLCRESCAGLCPHCGADLNERRCDCAETPSGDRRWATLEELREPPSEGQD
jgi:uncharacterized metal-binding protein YceD (DUF177 family)